MKVSVNGTDYHIDMVGEGFPLVVLHGFTGNGASWRRFGDLWSNGAKLIMIDIIGHGETEAPCDPERYSMDYAVGDLAELLRSLGIDYADFLGYSMGGRLALSFAVKYPEMVRKLVLESASPGLKTEEERVERRENDALLAKRICNEGLRQFVDFWEGIPLFQTQTKLPVEVQQRIREQRLTNSELGLSNSLIGMGTGAQTSNWEALSELTCETLLITGSLDKKFCQIASEMCELVKNSKWIVVDGCGHAIHVEQEEKFGTIVREFLQST